jgi:hypothetical protein
VIDRRKLIQILGGGVASGAVAAGAAASDVRFLTPAEHGMVDQLCELLIPADASGPGAREARVADYIDVMLRYAPPSVCEAWRAGLASVERAAIAEFSKALAGCSAAEQAKLMDRIAAGENRPETEIEKFFVTLKNAVIQGFSISEQGRQALGYRGDRAVHEFTGCTHPDHQRA